MKMKNIAIHKDSYVCGFCHDILVKPHLPIPCMHRFCEECSKSLTHRPCFICKEVVENIVFDRETNTLICEQFAEEQCVCFVCGKEHRYADVFVCMKKKKTHTPILTKTEASPLSAYLLYSNIIQSVIIANNPSLSETETLQRIEEGYRALSITEKNALEVLCDIDHTAREHFEMAWTVARIVNPSVQEYDDVINVFPDQIKQRLLHEYFFNTTCGGSPSNNQPCRMFLTNTEYSYDYTCDKWMSKPIR